MGTIYSPHSSADISLPAHGWGADRKREREGGRERGREGERVCEKVRDPVHGEMGGPRSDAWEHRY